MKLAPAVTSSFANRLYEKLAEARPGENLFFSPFSIDVALAMTAVGARGETRRVMADLIDAPESVDEQNRHYATVIKTLHEQGERRARILKVAFGEATAPVQLAIANALWGQTGLAFNPTFQEAIADCYDGALHLVDFQNHPGEAVETINAWVSDKTQTRIKELVNRQLVRSDTILILTNAIYFKANWMVEFNKAATRDETWHGGSPGKVPMMHQKAEYLYYEDSNTQALEIPYVGKQLSMLIVLPRKNDGLPATERQWTTGNLHRQVLDGLESTEVQLWLPRFRMEFATSLVPILCAMGAEAAFTRADFSGIGVGTLLISEVVHKAFVDVNEEGTVAAAATAVIMSRGIKPRQPDPKIFKADHPFLFMIRDRATNTILFLGRVMDPK
jgi:serpin B